MQSKLETENLVSDLRSLAHKALVSDGALVS